jgi:protein-ribulosamine 3-kinase
MGDSPLSTTLAGALGAPVRELVPLGGSFAGQLYRVRSAAGDFALKWAERPAPGALAAEARGLQLLAAAGPLRVPRVQILHDPSLDGGVGPAFLLIEWLDGGGARPDMAALGTALAALHRHTAAAYGLDHDNYLGGTPQLNAPDADWPTFFRERRLAPQLELAARNGLLPTARRRALERVLARLDDLLADVPRQPALLHGDLWAGNVLAADATGLPAVIDPAVHYADREAELAFTELFGGFGPRFYEAYHAAWPLEPGYADRRDLYNLYHLLNHLNLFGESYGPQLDAVARRYAGSATS